MSRTEIASPASAARAWCCPAYIIGRACAIHAGKHATMIQSFGPEARGSACSATLVISDDGGALPLHPPPGHLRGHVRRGLRQVPGRAEGRRASWSTRRTWSSPSSRRASRPSASPPRGSPRTLGRTHRPEHRDARLLRRGDRRSSPRSRCARRWRPRCPPGTEELNLKAFDAGWDYFDEDYGGRDEGGRRRPKTAAAGADDAGRERTRACRPEATRAWTLGRGSETSRSP